VTEVFETASCDCGDSWPSLESLTRGESTAFWLNGSTSYYPMIPSTSMVSRGAGHFLVMQVFFTCEFCNYDTIRALSLTLVQTIRLRRDKMHRSPHRRECGWRSTIHHSASHK
jgi:hypothetical protein